MLVGGSIPSAPNISPEFSTIYDSHFCSGSDIRPHPLNDKLYKTVDPKEPDVSVGEAIAVGGVVLPAVPGVDAGGHLRVLGLPAMPWVCGMA